MPPRTPFLSGSLALVLFSLALPAQASGPAPEPIAPDLLRPFVNSGDPMFGKFPLLRQGRRVAFDLDALDRAKPGQVFRLEFFKDVVYYARLVERKVAPSLSKGYHWHGTLVGKTSSQFTITVGSGGIASWFCTMDGFPHTLTIEGSFKETYARIYDDAANHAKGIQMNGLANQAIEAYVKNGGTLPSGGNAGCNDDPARIDVACYYTALANAQALNTCATRISNGIAQANTVLKNSGIAVTLYLVANAAVSTHTVENSSMSAILTAFRSQTDGNWDSVHADRKNRRADLAALIVADVAGHGNTTGIGYVPTTAGSFRPDIGFTVTEWNAIAGYTLIHEFGHNLGCFHDPANSTGTPLYPYAYGFNKKFCERGFPIYNRNYLYTIMSYRPAMSCSFPWVCLAQRVASFSGTNITWDFGSPCGKHVVGSATQRNNLVINNTRGYVANYSRVLTGTNVSRLVTVRSSNPASGVAISVSLRDANGLQNGSTSFVREYCGTNTVVLTAPSIVGANPFKRWVLNSVARPLGTRTLGLSTTTNHVAVAEFYIHVHGTMTRYGSGCPGTGSKVPALDGIGHADAGQQITLRTSNARPLASGLMNIGLSKTQWGAVPLPFDLGLIGMTSCKLHVSLDAQFPIATNASGVSDVPVTVSTDPKFLGLNTFWQTVIFDPAAQGPTKAVMSNAVDLKQGGNK